MASGLYAVTDLATGGVLRMGYSVMAAGTGELLYVNVLGQRTAGVGKEYTKIVTNTLTEMTAAEKLVVDATQSTVDAVNSTDALKIKRTYATVVALPATPKENGLLVGVDDAGNGQPGLACSQNGNWYILQSI